MTILLRCHIQQSFCRVGSVIITENLLANSHFRGSIAIQCIGGFNGRRGCAPTLSSLLFIVEQVLEKIGQIIRWHPFSTHFGVGAPFPSRLVNSESSTALCTMLMPNISCLSIENLSANYQPFLEDVWDAFGKNYDFNYPEDLPSSAAHYFSDYQPQYDAVDFFIAKPPVSCKPMPGESPHKGVHIVPRPPCNI